MKQWKSSLRSLYLLQYIRKCFLSSIQFLFKLSISFRLLVWMRFYFHFFLFVCVRGEVLIVALYRWFNGFLTIYFGGARSKGLAMLRNVPKLLFWDKIGHAKSFRQSPWVFGLNRLFDEVRAELVRDISRSLRVLWFILVFFLEERIIILTCPGFEPAHV